MTADPRVPQLLFLCTANQCRSPIAAAFARHQLTLRAAPCLVRSAGLMPGGAAANSDAVRIAKRYGIDISHHRSVQVDAALLSASDVVLTMEGTQVLDLADIDGDSARRAMPLKRAINLAEAATDRPVRASELRDWATSNSLGLDDLLDPCGDIADPVGRSRRQFRQTTELIRDEVIALIDTWFWPLPS